MRYAPRGRSGGIDLNPEPARAERPREPAPREVVFGVEPIRELLAAAPGVIRALYVGRRHEGRFGPEIARVREAGGLVSSVDDGTLARMAGSQARHQGMVAVVREYGYASPQEVLAGTPDPLLIVDGVTDPRNLGAILRSAEGAGVGALMLARERTAGVTPAAIKSSAGAWAHLRIARCPNVARMLETLKENGYWIAALVPDGPLSLYELDTARRLALVVGSEDRGVRRLVRQRADFAVRIPMLGKINSLNVAVATAIALFEIRRRRDQLQAP